MEWTRELLGAVRSLRQARVFAIVVVAALALGIGGVSAIFAVLDAAVLHPVPYAGADRLVSLLGAHPQRGVAGVALTPADFLALRERRDLFVAAGAYVPFGSVDLTGGDEPVRLKSFRVSDGLLGALAVRPAQGRLFRRDEYAQATPGVVLLSDRFWRSRLHGARDIVGRRLLLDGAAHEVIGVLPARFRLPGGDPDVLLPLPFDAAAREDRSSGYLGGIARLREGVTPEAATAAASALAARFAQALPPADRDLGFQVQPLARLYGAPGRGALLALLAAVGLVLLISCANVANLQLVRGLARRHETGVRVALGASRARLLRALALESALLAGTGALAGLALAAAALRWVADPRGIYLPTSVTPTLGWRVLLVTVAAAAASALLAGVAPAWRAVGTLFPDATSLRAPAGTRHERLQGTLVLAEIVLAFVLLSSAGLLLRSALRLGHSTSGLDARHALVFDLALPAARYPSEAAVDGFYATLEEHLARLGGVTAVGAAKEAPPRTSWTFQASLGGSRAAPVECGWELVTPGYFAALGTPLRSGRALAAADAGRRVALLDETAARALGGVRSPLGATLRFNGDAYEIVGVVAAPRLAGHFAQPTVYLPFAGSTVPLAMRRALTLVVRAPGGPERLAGPVRRAVAALDDALPLSDLEPLERRLAGDTAVAQPRFDARLLAIFAGYGLLLALLGLYGLLAFLLEAHRREIGIRLALGARPAAVGGRVAARALALAGGGALLGAVAATGALRALRAALPAVEPADPRLLLLAAAVVVGAALLGAARPALRAMRVDAVRALREP